MRSISILDNGHRLLRDAYRVAIYSWYIQASLKSYGNPFLNNLNEILPSLFDSFACSYHALKGFCSCHKFLIIL